MTTPLVDDPSARIAADHAHGAGGKLLAIYASLRSTSRVPDPLIGLGLPLIAYVLDSVAEAPARVTALRGRHSAVNPVLGLGTEVEFWSVLIRCRSGMTITLDVAAGPWTAVPGPVELRVEWMGSERVTALHPRGATIITAEAVDGSLGLTGLEERLLTYAEELSDRAGEGTLPPELDAAMWIVEAARASAASALPVELDAFERRDVELER